MSVYQVVWSYQQWRVCRAAGDEISPLGRAVFAVFFFPSLVTRVREKRLHHDLEAGLRPVAAGIAFIGLQLTWRLPDPWWLAGHLSALPILLVQHRVNDLNRQLGFGEPRLRVGVRTVLAAIAGGIVWLLVLVGLFFPTP